ncbi:MAG: DUF711 family protein, partial [Candidatus Korarchaeota archaeon]|nr:DUF711 family protein [Candidatus Korarchaeota archaeon]
EQGRGIAGEIGTAFIGIDVSPSPWMEMSVARVVEALSGVSVGAPGSLSAIRRLNEAVWRAGKGLPLIGFNETMLPVAEDNVLKVRTLEGLRVRDLALLTLGCLAGIDMVVLPWEGGAEALGGLILDQVVVHRLKAMPLGMRVILYEGVRPGDKVELDKFGAVPVSAL